MKTKEAAIKKARALRTLLKGKGWKICVWENLGWHYSLSVAGLTVYPAYRGYSVILSVDGDGCGEMFWTESGRTDPDPNEGVKRQLKVAKEFIKDCQKTIKKVEKGLKGKNLA